MKPLERFFCAVANVAGFMFENLESTMTGADDNKTHECPSMFEGVFDASFEMGILLGSR